MIKVFSQKYCPRCDELKKLLNESNISYEESDITEDNRAYSKLLFNDIDETPAVEINNTFLSGEVTDIYNGIKGYING